MCQYRFLLAVDVVLIEVVSVFGCNDGKKLQNPGGILENTFILFLLMILAWVLFLLLLGKVTFYFNNIVIL